MNLFHGLLENASLANKARLLSESASHAAAWLSVVPSIELGLHLEPNEYQVAVRWWLGLDTSGTAMCLFCPGVGLDPLGHHCVTCRHGEDVVWRHNLLREAIASLCRTAHLSIAVEKGGGGHDHTRTADVLIAGGIETNMQLWISPWLHHFALPSYLKLVITLELQLMVLS